jgi:hypothetical protein
MGIPKAKRSSKKSAVRGSLSSQRYKLYLKKEIDEYNATDLVFYFSDAYKKARGAPYFIGDMVIASSKMKRLQADFDNYTIVKLIDYVVKSKQDIGIGLLCSSWVNSFVRDAGITHSEYSKYEIVIDSPFLTKSESEVTKYLFNKMVDASDNGDIHEMVVLENKLEGICKEAKRRKVLLTTEVEEDV